MFLTFIFTNFQTFFKLALLPNGLTFSTKKEEKKKRKVDHNFKIAFDDARKKLVFQTSTKKQGFAKSKFRPKNF